MNAYNNYYINQAGSGIAVYSGNRYQRGHGLFGRLFSNAILPALKYLGKQALGTGVGIAQDVIDGENFKTSAIRRSKASGKKTMKVAIGRANKFLQTGKGLACRRKRKLKRVKSKSKKKKIF